ncbi:MAG: type II toxin-antitoxin system HicB family antitoxin [Blastocatellia bacterium]
MKSFDVFVQRDNGVFRALVPSLPNISADGASSTDAVENAKKAIEEFFKSAEVTTVSVDVPGFNPRSPRTWIESAGTFKGNEDEMLRHIEEIYAERKRQREAVERELGIAEEIASPDPTFRPGSPKSVLRAAADCHIDPNDELYRQYVAEMEVEEQRQRKEVDKEADWPEGSASR